MTKVFNTYVRRGRRAVAQAIAGAANFVALVFSGTRIRNVLATILAARKNIATAIVNQVISVVSKSNFAYRITNTVSATTYVSLGFVSKIVAYLIVVPTKVAQAVQNTVARLLTRTTIGFQVLKTFAIGSVRVLLNPAVFVKNQTVGKLADAQVDEGVVMEKITINLSIVDGATTVTQVPVGGRSDFTNPNNAAGKANGTVSTVSGNALGARSGRLNLTYRSRPDKDSLVIQSVQLRFHVATAGLNLTPVLTIGYRIGGGADVQLEAFTTASLNTPQVYDLTSVINGSWTTLSQISTYVSASFAVAAIGASASVDAVEILVTASREVSQST